MDLELVDPAWLGKVALRGGQKTQNTSLKEGLVMRMTRGKTTFCLSGIYLVGLRCVLDCASPSECVSLCARSPSKCLNSTEVICVQYLPGSQVHGGDESGVPTPPIASQLIPGNWRDQDVTRVYCSRQVRGHEEGALCTHGPNVIHASHWSCCGGLVKRAECTKVSTDGRLV